MLQRERKRERQRERDKSEKLKTKCDLLSPSNLFTALASLNASSLKRCECLKGMIFLRWPLKIKYTQF